MAKDQLIRTILQAMPGSKITYHNTATQIIDYLADSALE